MNKKLTNLILSLIDGLDHELENSQSKDIFKLHSKNRQEVLDKVADVVLKYDIDDNILNIPTKDRVKIKREMSSLISKIAKSEYISEKEIVNQLLTTSAVERYYINSYFYGKTFNINMKLRQLPTKRLKKIVDKQVLSKRWSDRLWTNKRTLEKTLRKEIYDLVDGKTDVNKIARNITERYGQNLSRSRTLTRTESTRVQGASNEEWARTHGVERQIFNATLDHRTSEVCQGLDGEFFDMDDPNKPTIPVHPNCRSALLVVPFKDWKPTIRRDNITKKNINYVKYREWKGRQ